MVGANCCLPLADKQLPQRQAARICQHAGKLPLMTRLA
jgi:hypothetical protein